MPKKKRYWLVSFNYVNRDGSTSFGSECLWSEGMLNCEKAMKAIVQHRKMIHIAIVNLFEFNNESDYNEFLAKSKKLGFSAN